MKGVINVDDLSTPERIRLAQLILDTTLTELEPETLTKEQLAEVRRRCEEIDSGKVVCRPWEEIEARLRGQK